MLERKPRKPAPSLLAEADSDSGKIVRAAAKPPDVPAQPAAAKSAVLSAAQILRPIRPTIKLDQRVLTKAQQHKLAAWNGGGRNKALDHYLAGLTAKARIKFGQDAVMVADEMSNMIIGIPSPSLAFEYVITQDCFPLGLIIHLAGKSNTNKSALLAEFFRWFIAAAGIGNLFEVESKISTDFLPSIVGYEDARRICIDNCNSVEDWQQHLLFWLHEHKQKLVGTKEEPGPGRTVPVLFGVDSIMGKAAWETQEKVRDQGYGSRNFPVEALSITQFTKTIPHLITNWPFAIVLNNHMKIGTDEIGREVRRTGGGAGVGFQESFELETKVRKSDIECADWKGRVINIKCWKNSYGDTYRDADTRILWWQELDEEATEQTGAQVWRQRTVWDWHWATVKLLTSLQGREKQRLDAVMHIKATKTSDVENAAYSSTLGMKEKDAVPWSELGAMIAADSKLMNEIRGALAIKRRPLLQGDYLVQMNDLTEKLP